jgi:hypothetical protein
MSNEIIDFYKKVLKEKNTKNEKDSIENEEIIEKVDESINESIISNKNSEEPFDNFLLKLSETLKENINKIVVDESPIIEHENIVETSTINTLQNKNPFNNFLKSIVETVENDKIKKEETIKEDTINFINNLKNEPRISNKIKRKLENKPKVKENKVEDIQYVKEEDNVKDELIVDEPKVSDDNDYVKELENTDKSENKIANKVDKHSNIKNIISEQVKEEVAKIKTQMSRMMIEGGGGGSVAVQYANGGTMKGDLNVTGKYLSGGIDLSTLMGTGGGGEYGDRLISGSESLILNPDGTVDFPNNTVSPKDGNMITIQSSNSTLDTFTRISLTPHGFFAYDENSNSITIDSIDNDIIITSQDTYEWKFNSEGALEGPNGTLSILGNLSASGRIFQNGNDLQSEIESLSAKLNDSTNWNSTYTTVQTNSSSWNYQGSDIKALTGNWQTAYTNLITNSAAYLSGYDLSFLSVSSNWNSTYTTVQTKSATEWDNSLANSYTQNNFFPLSGGTVNGSISATGVISASASNIRINIINSSLSRTFSDADNNRVIHIDTTTSSLCAIFPNNLSNGFNVAIMNTGTNNLVLSAAQLNSSGTIIATRYGGAFVYKDFGNLFAVGRFV